MNISSLSAATNLAQEAQETAARARAEVMKGQQQLARNSAADEESKESGASESSESETGRYLNAKA